MHTLRKYFLLIGLLLVGISSSKGIDGGVKVGLANTMILGDDITSNTIKQGFVVGTYFKKKLFTESSSGILKRFSFQLELDITYRRYAFLYEYKKTFNQSSPFEINNNQNSFVKSATYNKRNLIYFDLPLLLNFELLKIKETSAIQLIGGLTGSLLLYEKSPAEVGRISKQGAIACAIGFQVEIEGDYMIQIRMDQSLTDLKRKTEYFNPNYPNYPVIFYITVGMKFNEAY